MKYKHIILLVLIVVAIIYFLTDIGSLSSYQTIDEAKSMPGTFVHIIAKIDTSQPAVYDPIKNPNRFTFSIIDSLGGKIKVVYPDAKPTDIEKSERIVLTGKVINDYFDCKEILLKCPSKYKDNPNTLKSSY